MANIRITSSELEKFADVFDSQRRRSLLKRLEYVIELPTYSRSRREHAENCVDFEQATRDFFELLSEWEQEEDEQQDQESDVECLGPLDLNLHADWSKELVAEDPDGETRYRSGASRRFLTLSTADHDSRRLPTLHSVAKLTITGNTGRPLHPSAATALAAAVMPGLGYLNLHLLDPANRRVQLRSEIRAALAAGLLAALQDTPRPVHLILQRNATTEPLCHDYEAEDLVEDGVDDLCVALRRLGVKGKLGQLELIDMLVSEELFRTSEEETWPALRWFHIRTGLVAANGQWWYTGDRDALDADSPSPTPTDSDVSDDDWAGSRASTDGDTDDWQRDSEDNGERPLCEWRTRPDPAVFDPLMEAAARAVLRMPALEFGCFEIGVRWGDDEIETMVQWVRSGVEFVELPYSELPLQRTPPEELVKRRCGVWVGSLASWLPPASLMRLWREWVGDESTVEVKAMPGNKARYLHDDDGDDGDDDDGIDIDDD